MSRSINKLYIFDEFRLDADSHSLWRGESLVSIVPRALEVLILLVERRGSVVTRDELLENVWSDAFVEEGNINYTVSLLRKALGNKEFIKTVPKRGYVFVGDVQVGNVMPGGNAARPLERTSSRWKWMIATAVFVGVLLTAGLAFQYRRGADSPVTEFPSAAPEAAQAYTRGKMILENRNVEDREQKAVDEFQRAVRIDPTFALAYAGLSEAFASTAGKSSGERAADQYAKAKVAAQKALALEPDLAEGWAASGWVKQQGDWDFKGAELDLRRSIELNSALPLSHYRLSRVLAVRGGLDEALTQADRAYELDPVSELIQSARFAIWEARGEYEKGLSSAETYYNENRNNPQAARAYATFLFHSGQYARVVEIAEKGLDTKGKQMSFALLSLLAEVFRRTNELARADEMLRRLEDLGARDTKALYSLAINYAEAGRADDAIDALERCLKGREERLLWMQHEPRLANLRSDARYQRILSQLGLS